MFCCLYLSLTGEEADRKQVTEEQRQWNCWQRCNHSTAPEAVFDNKNTRRRGKISKLPNNDLSTNRNTWMGPSPRPNRTTRNLLLNCPIETEALKEPIEPLRLVQKPPWEHKGPPEPAQSSLETSKWTPDRPNGHENLLYILMLLNWCLQVSPLAVTCLCVVFIV